MPIRPGAIPCCNQLLHLLGNIDHFLSLCFVFFDNRWMCKLIDILDWMKAVLCSVRRILFDQSFLISVDQCF